MAFVAKQFKSVHRNSDGTRPLIAQTVKVDRATAALPATTTATIFNVLGGRILVKALYGEVTTAIQNQACNLSVVVDSDAGAADDLASAADVANLGVGTHIVAEGDGTAVIFPGIGWGQMCLGNGVIVGAGLIRLTTSATNTGSVKWTILYEPIDETAYVTAA